MSYYIGTSPTDVIGSFIKRYFYGMRRNDDGELFLIVADQLAGNQDSVTINELGIAEDNFLDFEEGIDFLDGIDANHNIVYKNLRYQQIRWDDRSLVYYVEPNTGQFVQRVTETYVYPDGISGTGY
jgi:hypothetical protein|tara:strand:+ start:2606 stop:2983 length:378 start_codon:yes stop_codon:yes gene_type:complete